MGVRAAAADEKKGRRRRREIKKVGDRGDENHGRDEMEKEGEWKRENGAGQLEVWMDG